MVTPPVRRACIGSSGQILPNVANLSPSLGVVQLVHLGPRQRRGFLDGLLSHEGVGVQPARDEVVPIEPDRLPSVCEPYLEASAVIVYAAVRDDADGVAFGHG